MNPAQMLAAAHLRCKVRMSSHAVQPPAATSNNDSAPDSYTREGGAFPGAGGCVIARWMARLRERRSDVSTGCHSEVREKGLLRTQKSGDSTALTAISIPSEQELQGLQIQHNEE